MAEKNQNQNQYHPPAANGYSRSGDTESLDAAREARRKKRIKWAAYAAAFVVFQTIVILVFVMVVMKVRTPKFRIGEDVVIGSWNVTPTPASFDISFEAPIRIKNNNFGPYKYEATTVDFTYGGVRVGQLSVPKGKARFMGTKKLDLLASVKSTALTSPSELSSELSSKVLTLNGQGRLDGKAEIMLIFKKKKATDMNCTMEFDVSAKKIDSVECK